MSNTTTTRAVVYVRISKDTTGEAAGVRRQRNECHDRIEERGWTLVQTFEDNDMSASRGDPRPGWEACMTLIKDGHADVLVCWASDRLTRHPRELEDLVDLLEATGTKVATIAGGDYDLATPNGRMVARMLGAAARNEVELKGLRQESSNRDRAKDGRRMGGRRPFGYEQDGVTIRESEADVYREMVQRVIDGDSIRGIALDLQARGIKTSAGNEWRPTRVSEVLRNPRYIGKRTYKGEVVSDAEWDGLVSDEDWQKLQSVLDRPERRWRGGKLKRWLTGFAVCGKCGNPLGGGAVYSSGKTTYVCPKAEGIGCGGLSIRSNFLEDHTEGLIVAALSTAGARARFVKTQPDAEGLAEVETEIARIDKTLESLDTDHYDGHLSRSRWLTQTQRLKGERTEAEGKRTRMLRATTVAMLPEPHDVKAWWASLKPVDRRKVARLLFASVTVNGARNLGGKPDLDRIKVEWAA